MLTFFLPYDFITIDRFNLRKLFVLDKTTWYQINENYF